MDGSATADGGLGRLALGLPVSLDPRVKVGACYGALFPTEQRGRSPLRHASR
jgi:hypothetical protein